MRLLHIDFETTGLDPTDCQPIEVAAAIWNDGIVEAEFESLFPVDPTTCYWEPGALRMAVESGLYGDLADEAKKIVLAAFRPTVEARLVDWIVAHKAHSLMPCGFSVQFDRAFLETHMGRVRALLHGHRIFDLSTLRAVWKPEIPFDGTVHRALDDVRHGVEFLNHWLDRFQLGPKLEERAE